MTDHNAETVSIPRPAIHTGPKHQTVDEATVAYLLEAATRVVNQQILGSGVSALVARTLTDVAVAMQATSEDVPRTTTGSTGSGDPS